MSRRWKIALAILAGFAVLLAINAVVTSRQTKSAEVTVKGAEIVRLPGGDLQVLDVPGTGDARHPPIVLLHGFGGSIGWWDRVIPALSRARRVVAIDLLGHGGSEKPRSGYGMTEQAQLVAQALNELGVRDAVVVGHSMGAPVGTALAEESPDVVGGLVIVDEAPDNSFGELGLLARMTFVPVLGEALWRVKTDFTLRSGLEEGFAPGFDVPDQFIEDLRRLTYSAYDASVGAEDEYMDETPLDRRVEAAGVPLLVIFGAEEQIYDPAREALDAYEGVPRVQTELIEGAGHSPQVENPAETARLILDFARRIAAERRTSPASDRRPSPTRRGDR